MAVSILPDSAPFNAEQRAWLNGFLAGWLGLQEDGAPAAPLPAGLVAPPAQAPPEEDYPWHDPALAIDERMRLAEGKPQPLRLMAAMAQLDCGSCGYLCKTYSEAIAGGAETSLTLCSPGGTETAKMVKKLVKEAGTGGSTNRQINGSAKVEAPSGWSRKDPYEARLARTVNLNHPDSDKATHHVEIDLGDDGPAYEVGDSLGVYPTNCGDLIGEIVEVLGANPDHPVETASGRPSTLAEALERHCCLSEVTEEFLQLLADRATSPDEARAIRALIEDDAAIQGHHAYDLLLAYPSARPTPEEVVRTLAELKPRLYSISSSPRRHKGQVHLTVRKVVYDFNNRGRKGVASTMLADRVPAGGKLRVYVQKSHGFTIPANPDDAAIMIGPGTGIAPFRAFLHERDAIGAKGKNWLFFGDQRSQYDFLYRDELDELSRKGVLTRLDTAFSRDQSKKIYVQDRIIERGAEVHAWLEAGAHVFVCGDAKRMAADVDRALREVVRVHGSMSEDAANAHVAQLSASGRYRRDVY